MLILIIADDVHEHNVKKMLIYSNNVMKFGGNC